MSQLRRNIVANFVGRGWSVFASFAFIPLYVRFLGIEAYGLIGFYTTLMGVFAFADVGLSASLNREMARLSALDTKGQEMRDLLRTLETIYWVIAVLLASAMALSAPTLAHQWVNAQTISSLVVENVVRLMGLAMAFQFPSGLYQGGLIGLQRQVPLNGALVLTGVLRAGGAVLILWLVSPTIEAFFIWQIVVNLTQMVLTRHLLWRSLPRAGILAHFRRQILSSIWRYSAGMMGMTITSALLTQMDKLVVSKLLPLATFGYYSVAVVVSQVPSLISGPVMNAVFPAMTQLVSVDQQRSLGDLFHRACQFMSVLVFPVGMVIIFFSRELVSAWMHDSTTADSVYPLVTLFMFGSVPLALQVIPYSLALAHGWIRLNLVMSIVTVVTVIPLMAFLIGRYGATGGPIAWILINGVSTPIYVHLLLRRLLPGHELQWYVYDIGYPLVAALIVVALGRWVIRPTWPTSALLVGIISVSTVAVLASGLAAPRIRGISIRTLRQQAWFG